VRDDFVLMGAFINGEFSAPNGGPYGCTVK